MLEQDYPDFEVIVIYDDPTAETDVLLRDLCKLHPKLRTTFAPKGANNLSTKKLGITLGIKAAKHEYFMCTDADACPRIKPGEHVCPYCRSHWFKRKKVKWQQKYDIFT